MATALVRFYQLCVSPYLPVSCRYVPSCSHYACGCYQNHGFFKATWLVLKRLGRCHPFGGSGFDPVPSVGSKKMRSFL